MKEAIFLTIGAFLGFDLALGYSLWTIRRTRRHRELIDRIRPYTGS